MTFFTRDNPPDVYRGFDVAPTFTGTEALYSVKQNGKTLHIANTVDQAFSWIDHEIRRQRLEVFNDTQ